MTMRQVLCILGMHRSGTSLVTRLLNLLGVYLGPEEHLIKPGYDNPKGFWEHQLLTDLNEEILREFGGNHLEPPQFPEGWESSPKLAGLRARARAVIKSGLGDADIWGWKDPRACLTLPFWQRLLPPMKYVICLRNPVDVASSVEARNHLSFERAVNLWLTHVTSALKYTVGQPRLFVFYEDIMEDWREEFRHLAQFLGNPGDAEQPDIQTVVEEFIDAELQHYHATMVDAVDEPKLAFPAKALYVALRLSMRPAWHEAGNHVDRKLLEVLDTFSPYSLTAQQELTGLRREIVQFQAAARTQQDALANREQEIASLTARREALSGHLDSAQTALQQRDLRVAELESEQESRDRVLTEFEARLQERERDLVGKDRVLAEFGAELQEQERDSAEKDRVLAELEARLQERERDSAEKDRVLAELEVRLQEQERDSAGKDHQLAEALAGRESQQRELWEIGDSLAWMLTLRYRRLRDTCVPNGTRRRRVYDSVKNFFKVLLGTQTKTLNGSDNSGVPDAVGDKPQTLAKPILSNEHALDSQAQRQSRPTVGSSGSPSVQDQHVSHFFAQSAGISSEYVPIAHEDIDAAETDVKVIAFYLPQFHPIPENDVWWGAGFTEWTQVSKAVPQFIGHYQPHLPGELGFYDLRLVEVQKRQIELARKYGIYGFCYHYYWFGGKRLLERPLKQFLEDSDLDLPFCLCWANESWTRQWDGLENEILVAQTHSPEDDLAFLRSIEPALRDKRYIRINGRPLLIIYRPSLMPDPGATAQRWRDYCQKSGIDDLYLAAVQAFDTDDPPAGFDAAVEFPPHKLAKGAPLLNSRLEIVNPAYQGAVVDYLHLVESAEAVAPPRFTLFRGVCPSWDNEPRRPGRGYTLMNSSPALYKRWLTQACLLTAHNPDPDKRIVFINAWNEWGEGAHIEPDRKFGYAYLQATANTLKKFSKRNERSGPEIVFVSHDAARAGAQRLLLTLIQWLREEKGVQPKIVLRRGGVLTPEFRRLGPVLEMEPLWAEGLNMAKTELARFCGDSSSLIYINTLVSGDVADALAAVQLPIITHVHEMKHSIQRWCRQESLETLFRLTDHFIAVAPPVARNLEQAHGVTASRISTIYEFIRSANQDLGQLDKVSIRRAKQLPARAFCIFGSGTLDWRKAPDLFIEVAAQTRAMGLQGAHFYWLGAGTVSQREALEAKMVKLGLQNRVRLIGEVADPQTYFAAGDVFLLTSREDPFPLVCLEAADCGLPIICFERAGGMPDFVSRGAGFVVPFEDTKAMAEKVVYLHQHAEERIRIGATACEEVRKNHDVTVGGEQIFEIIEQYRRKSQQPAVTSLAWRSRQGPMVSIVVPNYNHGPFLRQRLDSIRHQAFQDFEVIVLDDASTDQSREIIRQYQEKDKFRVFVNETNSGSAFRQWQRGLDLAQGKYLWFAESDDFASTQFLSRLVPIMENQESTAIAYCQSHLVDPEDRIVGDALEWTADLDPLRWTKDFFNHGRAEVLDYLSKKNTIPNASAALLRISALKSVGPIDDSYRLCGDWLHWIKVLLRSDIAYVADKLNYWRQRSSNARSLPAGVMEWEEGEAILRYLSGELSLTDEQRDEILFAFLKRCREWRDRFRDQKSVNQLA